MGTLVLLDLMGGVAFGRELELSLDLFARDLAQIFVDNIAHVKMFTARARTSG